MKHFLTCLICCLMLLYPSEGKAVSDVDLLLASSPCSRNGVTERQYRRCILLNRDSKHHQKLKNAVKGLGDSIRKRLHIPEGVRQQRIRRK